MKDSYFHKSFSKKKIKIIGSQPLDSSFRCRGKLNKMVELRKKILSFRDIIDLPPSDGSASIDEVWMSPLFSGGV